MRALQSAVFTLAVLVTAGSVLAQNDGPGGPPGERGGRGGGRGGFGRGGFDRGYMGLLRIDEVREELKITEDQNSNLEKLREEMRPTGPPAGVDFGSLQDATPEEREAMMVKFDEARAAREKETRTKLAGVLDETQMKRLQGLWIQRAGALDALLDDQVATELKLNDDQKSKLQAQREEQRSQMRGAFFGRPRGADGNRPNPPAEGANPPAEGANPPAQGDNPPAGNERVSGFLERMQAARKASDEKAIAVLTDEQKAAFEAVKGAEFKFPVQQFGGFGGGRGRGEGGGEGGRRRGGPGRNAE